jgi:hypothetical protein
MESSPYTRLVELCERLAAATTQGEVEWTAEEETSFVYKRRAGSVGVRSRDRDGEPPYELMVYGPDGAKVENLFSEWTPDEEPAFWNPALAEVYRAARRNALGVDRILDDLFAELPPARSLETRTLA